MRVLIAEDDRDSRELLAWLLGKLGHDVVAVEDGEKAWAAFLKDRFRLVISDLLMPNIDGLELCRRIRAASNKDRYSYIIILTALIGKKDYLEGMEAGADDFMTKPFDADELKARLRVAERILSLLERVASFEKAARE